MTVATHRWTALLLLVLAPAAMAQTLDDEFIFFVNGTNVLVPNSTAEVVNDPLDPTSGNRVAKFNQGAWTHGGFEWARTDGVDATAVVGATYGESQTLYFRFLSDPANADQPGISIMLSDKTDDSGANDGTADNEFRLLWNVPNELHDGMWHDLAIPLPPATQAALEEARTAGDLADGAENWVYPGAWSNGGFGIGPGFGGSTDEALWREFEWDALYKIGPFWDHNTGVGGSIWLDDVYIGDADTDVSAASDPPSAMTAITVSADGPDNVVAWDGSAGFGGYNVYASLDPITDVDADGVVLLRSVAFDAAPELRHTFESPHPSFGSAPLNYAVTSLSEFGVENTDISASTGSVANSNLREKAFIPALTTAQADAFFDAVSAGTVTSEPFVDGHPVFRLDSSHRSPGDGTGPGSLPTDDDNSGIFRIGYTEFNELVVYGEITDDNVTFAGDAVPGGDTWMFDSAEIVFGNYDVRDVEGGGVLVGSPHQDMQRGAEPDYSVRVAGHQTETGDLSRVSTYVGWSLNTDFPSASAVERTDTGWRFLTLIGLDAIQNTDESDVFLPVPGPSELQVIPFVLALNDADGGTRETQIMWSIKPNVTGQWWNTPAMWESVALAGSDFTVDAEDGVTEGGFALGQTAPNPTAQTAEIGFMLGAARRVTIEVFNTLGQRVAVAADGTFGAGAHAVSFDAGRLASGVYVYRMTAGDYVATRRMTVVR